MERTTLRKVKPLEVRRCWLRKFQCLQNRKPHIWRRGLGVNLARIEQYHRVDNAFWMNARKNILYWQIKEIHRFDNFLSLVRESCTIDRNLAAHFPRRMVKCISNCYILQVSGRHFAKWPARSCEDNFIDVSFFKSID